MLAQRFSRLRESPVRYAALDPAHAQAIYNFLRMQSRVYGIPEMMGTQQTRQMLGSAHPLGMQMAQQIHHGDNEAAMVLPDLLEDHGMTPPGGPQGSLLLHLLQGMRTRMGDYGQLRGYGQAGHVAYGQRALPELQHAGDRVSDIRHELSQSNPRYHVLSGIRRSLIQGIPDALPTAYDNLQAIAADPSIREGTRQAADRRLPRMFQQLGHMNDFMSNYTG